MSWKYTKKGQYPLAYKTGHWNGKASDLVLAEDVNGNQFIAQLYEGHYFAEWYFVDTINKNDWLIDGIVRWMEIPD